MKELEKIWEHYQEYMKKEDESHDTDIDMILNGDEDVDYGDWTKEEVKVYRYALRRATTVYEAMKILKEETLFLQKN